MHQLPRGWARCGVCLHANAWTFEESINAGTTSTHIWYTTDSFGLEKIGTLPKAKAVDVRNSWSYAERSRGGGLSVSCEARLIDILVRKCLLEGA